MEAVAAVGMRLQPPPNGGGCVEGVVVVVPWQYCWVQLSKRWSWQRVGGNAAKLAALAAFELRCAPQHGGRIGELHLTAACSTAHAPLVPGRRGRPEAPGPP